MNAGGPDAQHPDEQLLDEMTRINNELVSMQRELASRNAELARMNEQKNILLGMAAHDLRSPLAVIRTHAELVEEDAGPALSSLHRELLETIRTTADFMLRLVDDVLDISRIESGRLVLNLKEVDLAALIATNLRLHRALGSRKQVEYDFVADEAAAQHVMILDPGKIEQVLNNLLDNARKFSPAGGRIMIRLSAGDDAVRIAISDQGPGIDADDIPKLFHPFGVLDRQPRGGEKSTGLGLAISRRIVEGHGGSIAVTSPPGEGATFTITLPPEGADISIA